MPPPSFFDLFPFWVKAAVGTIGFALTPVACVYVLARENKEGRIVKPPDLRRKLQRDMPNLEYGEDHELSRLKRETAAMLDALDERADMSSQGGSRRGKHT